MEYWLIETAPQGQGVNGGMMRRQAPEQVATNYVHVEFVEGFSRHVAELGGRIVMPKQEVSGDGVLCHLSGPRGQLLRSLGG